MLTSRSIWLTSTTASGEAASSPKGSAMTSIPPFLRYQPPRPALDLGGTSSRHGSVPPHIRAGARRRSAAIVERRRCEAGHHNFRAGDHRSIEPKFRAASERAAPVAVLQHVRPFGNFGSSGAGFSDAVAVPVPRTASRRRPRSAQARNRGWGSASGEAGSTGIWALLGCRRSGAGLTARTWAGPRQRQGAVQDGLEGLLWAAGGCDGRASHAGDRRRRRASRSDRHRCSTVAAS
jgi:hypothetical protein